MSTNKGNLTIRAEMLADSTKKAQIAPKRFGSPAHSCPFFLKTLKQLVGGKHRPNLNVLNFSRKKGYTKKIYIKMNLFVNLQWFHDTDFPVPKKNLSLLISGTIFCFGFFCPCRSICFKPRKKKPSVPWWYLHLLWDPKGHGNNKFLVFGSNPRGEKPHIKTQKTKTKNEKISNPRWSAGFLIGEFLRPSSSYCFWGDGR